MEHGLVWADPTQSSGDWNTPLDHYFTLREAFASAYPLGFHALKRMLAHPFAKRYPLSAALARVAAPKLAPPYVPILPPAGTFTLSEYCQLALLWALIGEETASRELAGWLAPIMCEGLTTLWSGERTSADSEVSRTLFLRAIGQDIEVIPTSPFFALLESLKIKIDPIPGPGPYRLFQGPYGAAAFTEVGRGTGAGALRVGGVSIPTFGPQMPPFSDTSRFGLWGGGKGWFLSSACKEAWFQLLPTPLQDGCSFFLQTIGLTPKIPMAWVFYVCADGCKIGDKLFKTKSLNRFLGDEQRALFDGRLLVETDRPLKMELIPLAGEGGFWNASFLLAFWLPQHASKTLFHLIAK
ncbi:MAG: hypothetical protein KGJ02_00680 [Verrucomicrobiota bacterium]|nr:hypothetical protein [Verrucomicrobiota bacterium]